jgi:two-component system, NtrC family, sensor histidine kinase PilS
MHEKKKNLAWLILTRLIVVSLFLASITYFNIRQPELFPHAMLRNVTRLITVTYFFSILSLVTIRFYPAIISPLGYAQIVWETLFVSILIVITGGITSTYGFFFNLAIINASYLFGRRESLYTASFCGIIYGLILELHYFGKLENYGLLREMGDFYGPNHILSLMFTNFLAFFLTAILTGYLAERARKSESALKEKVVDYEDLERVNSIIVSTLDSGLITINSQGRIRVFNRYASELTGINQQKAYDLELAEIFPEIDICFDQNNGLERKELIYTSKDGLKKILSIKTAPLNDKNGNLLGAVIDFKDLTEIRAMEARLKKTDRLAAIGELSARIAHEVRNPLASISGSVQLISDSATVPSSDKKLLDIILRETWRLDHMLSEFLLYSRPFTPVKIRFSLKTLITDLISLLKGDERFAKIAINNDIVDNIEIVADHDQFRQVLWNLLINAAESMKQGGAISLDCHYAKGTLGAGLRSIDLKLCDTGAGISKNDLELVFEPFFTTKAGGTGLGLATVYRILEAHNFLISVESTLGEGTCFTINIQIPENI